MKCLYKVSFILLVFISLVSCNSKSDDKKVTNAKVEIHKVKFIEVKSLQPTKEIILPGELKAWDRVEIHPRVRGFIKSIHADRGTIIKKGQLLALIEAPEVLEEYHQAHAQWQSVLAALEESNAKYYASKQGYTRLLKASKTEGAISFNELDLALARMLAESAIVIRTKESAKAAEANYLGKKEVVEYLKITAPFDGVIIERTISPGALVGPGSNQLKPLFTLENSTKLRLTIAVPEVYSTAIDPESSVSFTVNSIPDKRFKGVFARSAVNIDINNRVMVTEFDVDNKSYTLKAGMYAEVKLPIKRENATLFVPVKSVVSSSEKVFIIKANNGAAQWIPVRKGNLADSLIEVFGDLKDGDKIIADASEEIREGDKIE